MGSMYLPRSTAGLRPCPAASPMPEPLRVLCWRLSELAGAGYSDTATAVLAARPDVDLHRATDLLLRGCPQETALRILL